MSGDFMVLFLVEFQQQIDTGEMLPNYQQSS